MEIHILFAKISWLSLIIILYWRPIAQISNSKFLLKNLHYRKQLGIICGLAGFIHATIYLLSINSLGNYFQNEVFWSLNNFLGWGSLALVFMFLPLITSNNFSRRFLRGNWKKIQQLVYPTFIFVGLHIYLLKNNWAEGLLPVLIWIVLWSWAGIKNKKENKYFC